MKFHSGILGCLIKILIVILILALILVLAFVILGNLKMSTLKFDTIKLGDATLGELGLGDQKVKTVVKAALKLVNPNEEDFVKSPIPNTAASLADGKFSSLELSDVDGKPRYFTLLSNRAQFEGDPKIALSKGEIGYIIDKILASSQEIETLKIANTYKMRVKSCDVSTKDGKHYIDFTFSMDIQTITKELPNVPVLNWIYKWPEVAYLTYRAEITADGNGVLSVVGNPEIGVNGLEKDESEAIFTAVGKTKSLEPAEGKTNGDTVADSLTNVIFTALNNVGQVAKYGTDIVENIDRDDFAYGAGGIDVKNYGEIWFAKHLG